jgi:hypothetical protein
MCSNADSRSCVRVCCRFFYIKNSGISQEMVDKAFAINAKCVPCHKLVMIPPVQSMHYELLLQSPPASSSAPLMSALLLGFHRYFDQPLEEKLKLPRVDWGARKLLGYEINKLPGGAPSYAACPPACRPVRCLPQACAWLPAQMACCTRATSTAGTCTPSPRPPGPTRSSSPASSTLVLASQRLSFLARLCLPAPLHPLLRLLELVWVPDEAESHAAGTPHWSS